MARPIMTLRNILLFDAVTCIAMGALLTLAGAPLADLTALPPALLRYAGLALLPIGGFIAVVGLRAAGSRSAVQMVVVGNGAWVAASVALVLSDWVAPNALGYALVLVQASAVAALAVLESAVSRTGRHAAASIA